MQDRSSDAIIDAVIGSLEQGRELLEQLSDEIYAHAMPPIFNYGIGSHFRHLLDFYTAFLQGLESGRIDYDTRERDRGVEQNRLLAIARLDGLSERIKALKVADRASPVRVRLEDASGNQPTWSHSSVLREMQFLQSHTVHHYALIVMMLRLQGVEPAAGFGVALSTLKHWRAA